MIFKIYFVLLKLAGLFEELEYLYNVLPFESSSTHFHCWRPASE